MDLQYNEIIDEKKEICHQNSNDRANVNQKLFLKIVNFSKEFEEIANGLRDTFLDIGYDAEIYTEIEPNTEDLVILIGAHLALCFPKYYIIFQMEQISSEWITKEYITAIKNAVSIWDFSPFNIRYWISQNLNVFLVPIIIPQIKALQSSDQALEESKETNSFDYPNELMNKDDPNEINNYVEQPIDVLFYGACNPKRKELIDNFEKMNWSSPLNIAFCMQHNLFGEERDRIIQQSKLILSIHCYQQSVLEASRLSFLLAHGKCIVTEPSCDPLLDQQYAKAIVFSTYENLPQTCYELVNDQNRRMAIESQVRTFVEDQRRNTPLIQDALSQSYSIYQERRKNNEQIENIQDTPQDENLDQSKLIEDLLNTYSPRTKCPECKSITLT